MTSNLSFNLAESLANQLADLATKSNRSQSYHVRKALVHYFKRFADLEIAKVRLISMEPEVKFDEVLRELKG